MKEFATFAKSTIVPVLLVAASCSTAHTRSQSKLTTTIWNITSVSGDPLSKSGSTMDFGATRFRARLPCSTVSGSFAERGDVIRFSNVRTVPGVCEPVGQEVYFAGKLGSAMGITLTRDGVNLQNPPDYIELARP